MKRTVPRDWSYDPTGVLTGATDLGGGPPWGYAYETHLGGTIQWDLGSGEVTLGHTEGRPGADTYTGSHPDRPEVPALEGESWRRQLRTFTSPEGEVTQRDYTAQGQLASVTLPWGASTGMAYGADGEVGTQTLASGETVTFTHDAAGRSQRLRHVESLTEKHFVRSASTEDGARDEDVVVAHELADEAHQRASARVIEECHAAPSCALGPRLRSFAV